MSFTGSLGFVMDGCGIKNVIETADGEYNVKHMLCRKVIAKALPAHFLPKIALTIKLQ